MMIGTLDDPSLVDVKTHMFADEAFPWITYPKGHSVYAKHRVNEDGTPAAPLTQSTIHSEFDNHQLSPQTTPYRHDKPSAQ